MSAAPSFAEVDDLVPVAANGEVAGLRDVARRDRWEVRRQVEHRVLQRVADLSQRAELGRAHERRRHRGRDCLADQPNELLVGLVERAVRVQLGYDDRLQVRVIDAEGDAARRASRVPVVVEHDGRHGRRGLAYEVALVRVRERRAQTGNAHDTVGDDEVDLDRRQRGAVLQGLDRRLGHGLDRGRAHERAGQRTQRAQPSVVDDLRGRLGRDDQQTGDAVGVVADRAVRVREEGLLGVAVASDQQTLIGRLHGFAGEHTREERTDLVPNLGPGLAGAAAQCVGMLLASEDWSERVVVQLRVLRAPDEHHRELRGQHHLHQQLQLLGPVVDRSERSCLPLVRHDGARYRRSSPDRKATALRTTPVVSPRHSQYRHPGNSVCGRTRPRTRQGPVS